ncbi:hypothetical protein [Bordetella bronchiseptica]|uniref:hypothetical protein n=1 Tax=Bordetella bronchiseptica TaxID=518 RepID=UPI0012682C60|nr:hypothetical protein [Bordetella bronchiseptica]
MTTAERNAEIVRRRLAGERPTDLAAEFGVTITRIVQIVRRARARLGTEGTGEIHVSTPSSRGNADMPTVRPRLRKTGSGLWECTDGVVARAARSAQGAYQRWLTAAVADAMARQAVCAPAEPMPAHAPRRAPRQKAMPPAPRPLVGESVSEPVFTGEVQVLRGTPARPPLQFAASLGLTRDKLARVQAAQPPMRSLGGARQE